MARKMSSSKNQTHSNNCLSTILHHLICSNNLSSPHHPLTQLHNPHHTSTIVESNYQPHQKSQEPNKTPGIVARLMGLDSLPNFSHHQNYNSFQRSKSLKFLPNFDPTQVSTFHRRAITSASFRERGIGDPFFAQNEENPDFTCAKTKEFEVGREDYLKQDVKQRRAKLGNKERSGCMRREKSNGGKYYQRRKSNNYYTRNKSENSDEILHGDVPSRSPVSVLDRRRHGFDSPSKGDSKLVTSGPRRKSPGNKLKILDEKAPQAQAVAKLKFKKKNQGYGWNHGRLEDSNSIKTEMQMVGYFGVIFGQVSKLVEEEISDPKRWSVKYQMLKLGFIQHFCEHFGLQILDFLLDELMQELIVN